MSSKNLPQFRLRTQPSPASLSQQLEDIWNRSVEHRILGADVILPPIPDRAITLEEALTRLKWLRSRELETGRKQTDRNSEALELAITAIENMMDRTPRPGDHLHHCGVVTCGNSYCCHGDRCAGNVWICPACELDQRDTHTNGVG